MECREAQAWLWSVGTSHVKGLLEYALLKRFPAWRKLKSSQARAAIEELQKVPSIHTSTLLSVSHLRQSKVDEHKPAFNYVGVKSKVVPQPRLKALKRYGCIRPVPRAGTESLQHAD